MLAILINLKKSLSVVFADELGQRWSDLQVVSPLWPNGRLFDKPTCVFLWVCFICMAFELITGKVLIKLIIGFHNNLDISVREQELTRWSPIQSHYELHLHTSHLQVLSLKSLE